MAGRPALGSAAARGAAGPAPGGGGGPPWGLPRRGGAAALGARQARSAHPAHLARRVEPGHGGALPGVDGDDRVAVAGVGEVAAERKE
ncbi:hypothetical protein, partial [Streptomyces sp. NPDC058964]|uniref:hypothetical protein n=1 Tax=Streptomyces sp. NPDC058964 TaxID=3346681 RepID=UPI0036994D69